jgi:hypothetical protein
MYLKQNTAVTIVLPRFVDETDGQTTETGLTISQADVRLSKNAGTFAQKNDATACSHMENGFYSCPLNATDTNTLGYLTVGVDEAGALPVERSYLVVPANIYDSLVSGSDLLQVDTQAINDNNTAADNLEASAGQIYLGTTDNTGFTATTTIFETSSITTAAADHWIGRVIVFRSGTLAGQATKIEDYALSSGRGRFTVSTLTSAPANATTFVIV